MWPKNITLDQLSKVRVLHKAAKELKQHIEKHFLTAVPEGISINVGYHHRPSLQRMHLHLISNDFDSEHMKTKKHRDSFQTDFFVKMERFEKLVRDNHEKNVKM